MLTDEEIDYFLALLRAFTLATESSGRNASALFNVSVKTMARWLRAADGKGAVGRMYYSRINPIRFAIERMNRANVKAPAGGKPYRKIAKISEPAAKIAALKALMEATV